MLADARWALALGLCALAFGCSTEASPEAQVRQLVDEASRAASDQDLGALGELVSDDYADKGGNDKRSLRRLLAFQVLGPRSISVFTHVQSVEVPEPTLARVELVAAFARTAISSLDVLPRLDADLYRIEVELRLEADGRWRAVAASWSRVSMDEVL